MKPLVHESKRDQIRRRLEALTPWVTRNADAPTFDCPTCKDGHGFVCTVRDGIIWSRFCPDCDRGRMLEDGQQQRLEEARSKYKIAKVREKAKDDDLPF